MQGQGSGGGGASGAEEGIKEEPVSEEEVAKLLDDQTFSGILMKFLTINENQVRALERDRQKKDNHNISELYTCIFTRQFIT